MQVAKIRNILEFGFLSLWNHTFEKKGEKRKWKKKLKAQFSVVLKRQFTEISSNVWPRSKINLPLLWVCREVLVRSSEAFRGLFFNIAVTAVWKYFRRSIWHSRRQKHFRINWQKLPLIKTQYHWQLET